MLKLGQNLLGRTMVTPGRVTVKIITVIVLNSAPSISKNIIVILQKQHQGYQMPHSLTRPEEFAGIMTLLFCPHRTSLHVSDNRTTCRIIHMCHIPCVAISNDA